MCNQDGWKCFRLSKRWGTKWPWTSRRINSREVGTQSRIHEPCSLWREGALESLGNHQREFALLALEWSVIFLHSILMEDWRGFTPKKLSRYFVVQGHLEVINEWLADVIKAQCFQHNDMLRVFILLHKNLILIS